MTDRMALTPRAIQPPKGMDVNHYLNQGELWFTADGMIRISTMTADHKRHALRWLQDSATGLILVVESVLNEDILSGSNPYGLGDVLALMSTRPKEWVAKTTLYKALEP